MPKSHLTPSQTLPFILSHSGHSALRTYPPEQSPGHLGYYSDVSASVLDFGEVDPETTGPHGLLHPAGKTSQVVHVGPEVSVTTASGQPIRSSQDRRVLQKICSGGYCTKIGSAADPTPYPTQSEW